jgi:hypothetical protein
MTGSDRTPVLQPPMICVADVDTRLTCSMYCALCQHYTRDRRNGERRGEHRHTRDRRILHRA